LPSTLEGMSKVVKFSVKPTLAFLFHPVYTVVNAAVCGRLGVLQLAGFGLGSLTLGIMAISVGTMFSISVATLVSQASGANDKRMCRVYLNRQYFLNTLFYPIIVLPLLFVKQIYTAIG
jgi:Na+-driven multidrug efflux pump